MQDYVCHNLRIVLANICTIPKRTKPQLGLLIIDYINLINTQHETQLRLIRDLVHAHRTPSQSKSTHKSIQFEVKFPPHYAAIFQATWCFQVDFNNNCHNTKKAH